MINRQNYNNITRMVESAEKVMREAAALLQEVRTALKEKTDLLKTGEHIMGGGHVAELVAGEKQRRQADMVPNGCFRSDTFRR